MNKLTRSEKRTIEMAIKRLNAVRLEQWLKDTKRWRKRWAKKDIYK